MGAGITIDDSLWPLSISRFSGAVSDEQFTEHLMRVAAQLQRGESFVSVLDMKRVHLPTTAQRQRQTEWMRLHGPAARERLLGCAFIITSPLIRLALSSVFYLVPPPIPYIVVPDLNPGLHWALQRLEAEGNAEAAHRIRERWGLLEGVMGAGGIV